MYCYTPYVCRASYHPDVRQCGRCRQRSSVPTGRRRSSHALALRGFRCNLAECIFLSLDRGCIPIVLRRLVGASLLQSTLAACCILHAGLTPSAADEVWSSACCSAGVQSWRPFCKTRRHTVAAIPLMRTRSAAGLTLRSQLFEAAWCAER